MAFLTQVHNPNPNPNPNQVPTRSKLQRKSSTVDVDTSSTGRDAAEVQRCEGGLDSLAQCEVLSPLVTLPLPLLLPLPLPLPLTLALTLTLTLALTLTRCSRHCRSLSARPRCCTTRSGARCFACRRRTSVEPQ